MMTPENIIKGIAALRSGEYKQHRTGICFREHGPDGKLHPPTAFCCIGVMDIAANGSLTKTFYGSYQTHISKNAIGLDGLDVLNEAQVKYINESGSAPSALALTLGLPSILVVLNDDYEWSFDQIATLLELGLPAATAE